jgi:PAS domain-containing protein
LVTNSQDKNISKPAAFLAGGGDMAARIAAFDWSGSLGPVEAWPQSLKTIVGFMVHTPVPLVLLWGADGIMIYNDAYSVFAGKRHPGLLGSKVRQGWPEVADFNDNVMKVGLGGGTLSYKNQELALDRFGRLEPAWMNLDYSPVIDESGKPGGVMAIVVETTEQVLAQRKATTEQERQRRLFTQMPGFVGVLRGPQHVYEYVNPAYLKLAGDRDFIGKPVRQAFPELEGQGFFDLLDGVYKSGVSYVARGMPALFEGEAESRFVDFVYEPMRDESGAVTGVFVGGYESTEAYRANQALRKSESDLRESEGQFRAFAQAMPNHVWAAAPDGLLNWFNQRVYDYSGMAQGALDGMGWTAMVHPDDLEFAGVRWQASGPRRADPRRSGHDHQLGRHQHGYRGAGGAGGCAA